MNYPNYQNNNNNNNNNSNNRAQPYSQQSMFQQQMGGNMNNCFNKNPTLINKPDFSNKGGVIHNNLGDNLLEQKIVEYKIHIHTKDRDKTMHPSPFKIKVPFGTTQKFSINQRFTKVKYISLDSVILPKTIAIDVSHVADPNLYPCGSSYSVSAIDSTDIFTTLTNHQYLILKIDELDSGKNLGTSTMLGGNTFILYDDGSMGIDNVMWRPIHGTIIFPNSQPFDFSNLTMTFYDDVENELKLVDQNGNEIINKTITGLSANTDYNKFIKDNSSVASALYTDRITQVMFNFTVGVIENELNTTNY